MAALATEPRGFFALRPALAANERGLRTMERTRAGLLATPKLLKLFDWKIGDTVTLRSRELRTDGSGDWPFVIAGTFDTVENPGTAEFGIINYAYLDEARVRDRGTVERFYLRIADPNRAVAVGAEVDRLFANSSHQTWTRSDQERAEAQTKQMGDIAYFTRAIVAAVAVRLAVRDGQHDASVDPGAYWRVRGAQGARFQRGEVCRTDALGMRRALRRRGDHRAFPRCIRGAVVGRIDDLDRDLGRSRGNGPRAGRRVDARERGSAGLAALPVADRAFAGAALT